MNPEPRTRFPLGLLCAAIPALAFTLEAFYAWAGAGPRVLADWRWLVAGLAVFVGLVLTAGFTAIDRHDAGLSARHRRESAATTRKRIALVLLVAALLAYFFDRAAFSSWFFWLPMIPGRFRFLDFQDWYWWVGALVACSMLVLAAAAILSRNQRDTLERATTPIEDTSHRLLLDAHGNEIPEPSLRESETASRIPEPEDAAHATTTRRNPRIRESNAAFFWLLRFAITTVTVLVLMSLRLPRDAGFEVLAVLTMAGSVAFAVWIYVRNR